MTIPRNLSVLAQGAGSNQTLTLTNTSANALAVGRQGTTNPVLNVDASTASVATGLNVKGAAAAAGVALSVTSSGTNENLTIDAKGSGTITLNGTATGAITLSRATTLSAALTYGGVTLSNAVTGTGNMVLSAGPTFTGTLSAANQTLTTTSANALAVGRQGTTNPVLNVDASTASVVTGLNIKGAAAAAGLALSVTSSGTNEDIFIDPKGNGGIVLCNNSTGYVEVRQTTNGSVASYVRNNSTGTAAYSMLSVVSSTGASGDFRQNGSSFTTSGIYQQNGTMLVGGGAGGLTVGTTANQPVYFAQNTAEAARIGTDKSFLVGTTTNAGAGVISSSSSITSNSGQMIMGCPTGSYGSLGYAAKPAGTNAWTYGVSDYAVWIQYGVNSGTLQVYTAGTGTAGNAITPTQGPYVSNLGTSWTSPSDARLKDQFTAVSGVLGKLANIIVGTYVWSGQGQTPTGRADLGIRAQELHAQFPLLVNKGDDSPTWDSETSQRWGINESKVGIVALQAVKELLDEVRALENRISALEGK